MDFKIPKLFLTLLFLILGVSAAFSQTTYYSRTNQANPKAWDDANSWTLNSDGSDPAASDYPGQDDNIIILDGHVVEIDDILDNDGPALSAFNLSDPYVGPFAGSTVPNFYHTGNITIESGGSLITTNSVRMMVSGTTYIFGNLTADHDFINVGIMYMAPDASFDSGDDLILTGTSNTRIDINSASNSTTNDDVYLDHVKALLCGLGFLDLGNGGPDPIINLNNGAGLDQICSKLTITGCTMGPCAGTGTFNPTPPVLTATITNLMYTENDVVTVDPGISLTYGEPFLTSATISVSNNFVGGEDELDLPATLNISSNYNSITGVLTLTGYGGVSTWESILQNVTYENLSENPTISVREISFEITDGFATSNTVTRNIEIQAVNDPPDVSTISGSPTPLAYTEGDMDVPVDDEITLEDPDDTEFEGATIQITASYNEGEDFLDFTNAFGVTNAGFNPTTGKLTLTGTSTIDNYRDALRSITYENISDNPSTATRTVSFIVNDGDADSPPFDRDIEITPVNDPPTITSTAGTAATEDILYTYSATVNDPDDLNNGTELLWSLTNAPGDMVVSSTGVVTWIPAVGVSTSGVVTLTVQDGGENGALPDTEDFTITVTPFNDPPAITSTAGTTATEDILYTYTATVNDPDDLNNGTELLWSLTNAPGDMVVSSTGVVTWIPVEGDLSSGTVTLTVQDGGEDGAAPDTEDFTITVTPVNDPPVITSTAGRTATEETLYTYTATATDPDDANNGTDLIWSLTNKPGDMVVSSTGVVTWTPAEGVLTSGTLTLTVQDGGEDGALPDTEVFTITVTPVNDPPTITSTAGTAATEDILYTYTATVNDPDDLNNGTELLWSLTNAPGDMVVSSTGVVTWIPVEGDLSSGTVTLTVQDGGEDGAAPDTEDFTITVTPVNDPPVITSTAGRTATEETLYTYTATATDPDDANNGTDLIWSLTNKPGDMVVSSTGVVTWTPAEGVLTSGTLTLTVQDGGEDGALPDTEDFIITVTSVNDPPEITGTSTDLNYNEGDGPVAIDNQIVVSDVDDTDLEMAIISLGASFIAGEDLLGFVDQTGISGSFDTANGILTLSGTALVVNYMAALASVTYDNTSMEPNTTARNVSFIVNDGESNSNIFTRTILIIGINEPPVFEQDGVQVDTVRFTILEDEIASLCVEVSDPETNLVHLDAVNAISVEGTFDNGSASDLCFTYTPPLNFNGLVYGILTICDDGSPVSCANAVVEITVLPVNDPPVAEDDEYTVLEDEVVVRNVLDNDTDPDGDILTVTTTPVADPVNGQLILNPDGTFTYTPAKDFSGEAFFTYEVCDTAIPAACDEADVTIILQEVEDPVIVYQVLTPNDDNFNDLWVIDGIEQFPGNLVRVYDRWSSLVYQMQGYNNADKVWEGNSNEGITTGELPNGTYYYVISLGDGSDVLKGFVELKHQ